MITSTSNCNVKRLVQILNKPKVRKEQGVFAVEGMKMFLEAPRERISEVYVSEKFISVPSNLSALNGYPYEILKEEVFRHVSDTVTPQGIMALVKMKDTSLENMHLKKNGNLFLILEDIRDPGNLGTIVRSAEGAGVSGIIMTKNTVDIYNPKVIRSTMGSVYRVPFFYTDNPKAAVESLKALDTVIMAAHLDGEEYYYRQDMTGNTAFIIGNESNGISREMADMADVLIKIPMQGNVESLNASVAASVLMYEAFRQNNI